MLTFLQFHELNAAQTEAVIKKWPTIDLTAYGYDFMADGVTPYVKKPVTEQSSGGSEHRLQPLAASAAEGLESGNRSDRRHLVVIGCGKEKADTSTGPVAASELYVGPLFSARRRYAEASGSPWMILSAKHGLIPPALPVLSYDTTISDLSADQRSDLQSAILPWLKSYFGGEEALEGVVLELHAGADYVDLVEEVVGDYHPVIEHPVGGLAIGQQLAFYKGTEENDGGPALPASGVEEFADRLMDVAGGDDEKEKLENSNGEEFRDVPLWLIDDSPTQPRTIYSPEKHEELRKSMAAHGWLKTHALLLRPMVGASCLAEPNDPTNDEGKYVLLHPETRRMLLPTLFSRRDAEMIARNNPRRFERVYGHRRTRAAVAANIAVAPCVIREMSDMEVLEMQLVEGLKEELNPIDEAEHVKRLMALRNEHGKPVHTYETAAGKVGKEPDHLRKIVLLAELDGEAREAVAEGRLGVSIGYLVGGIPNAEARTQAAEGILNPKVGVGPLSFQAAADFVRRDFTRDLRKASFDTADAELRPPAPACVGCRFNSAFSEEKKAGGPKVGICGNIACYRAKEDVEWELWRAVHHQPENGRVALSRERCTEIFDGDEIDWKTGLVDLAVLPAASVLRDPDALADGGLPPWKDLTAGRLTEILVARDARGKKRELVELEKAKAAAELNEHLIFKTSPASRVERTRTAPDEGAHMEAVLEQKAVNQDEVEFQVRVRERLLGDVAGRAKAHGVMSRAFLCLLLEYLYARLQKPAREDVEGRRATAEGALLGVYGSGDEAELYGLAAEMILADCLVYGADDFSGKMLKVFGVSLEDSGKAVRAEMEAEKKKAEAKAAKGRSDEKKGKEAAGVKVPPEGEAVPPPVDSWVPEAVPDLPKGCEWISTHLGEAFEWNENGVCTNPEVLRIEAAAKKERSSLMLSVGLKAGLWYFGWNIHTRNGGDTAGVSIEHTGYPSKVAALRDAAAFLVLKVTKDEKVSEKTRARCQALARAFGSDLQDEEEAA